MLNDAVIDALWRAHLGLTIGLLAAMLLRRPLRRLAGPQFAYALWLLPLWLTLAALLPSAGMPALTLPPVHAFARTASPTTSVTASWQAAALTLWLAGVAAVVLLQTARHRRYVQRLMRAGSGFWRAPAGDSPGLLGVWRPRLVLPADFRTRFAADERRWILTHEAAHARRLDNPARLLATLLAGLAWFNPLAWVALSLLRHDQELACDAAVMQRHPGNWRRYGLALLKLDGAVGLPLTASAWQSHHPLKERIMLLKKTAPRAGARRAARMALAVSALLGLGVVQVLNASAAEKPASQRLTVREACPQMPKPELVTDAKDLKGKYQFEVRFRVGKDGRPDWIKIDGAERTLAAPIETAVRAYSCKPELAGTELQQEFSFLFD